MKTPEEIKRGLQEAPHVKYLADDPSSADGRDVRYGIVIGYVLREEIVALIERLAQAERERDALMYDFPLGFECRTCKHEATDCNDFPCNDCAEASREVHRLRWEWRGVCEENSR